jgi:hypothetical protein
MSDERTEWSRRAERLHDVFDAAFAAPPVPVEAAGTVALLMTVGGTPCAVPVGDCRGVVASIDVLSLPSRVAGFIGVAMVTGAVVPVIDLATRLTLPASAPAGWALLTTGPQTVAFLVDSIDGQATVASPAPAGDGETVVVMAGTQARRLVRLGTIVEAIAGETLAERRSQETTE